MVASGGWHRAPSAECLSPAPHGRRQNLSRYAWHRATPTTILPPQPRSRALDRAERCDLLPDVEGPRQPRASIPHDIGAREWRTRKIAPTRRRLRQGRRGELLMRVRNDDGGGGAPGDGCPKNVPGHRPLSRFLQI